MFVLLTTILIACGKNENECGMCNGSGYYDHRTCPACKGSGNSDFDPYEIADEMYGEDDDDDGNIWIGALVIGGIVSYCIYKKDKRK